MSTSTGGTFGPGVYRLQPRRHAQRLADAGHDVRVGNYFIQTSVDKQVNLVNADGLTLNYWDGDAGPKNGLIDGGSGTWRAGGGNQRQLGEYHRHGQRGLEPGCVRRIHRTGRQRESGQLHRPPGPGHAVCRGRLCLVNNDATDALTLTGAAVSGGGPNEAEVRVGDGSAGGAGYTANVAATLVGAARLVKTDLGTLTLSGVNTYTGGTAVKSGTLQVSQNLNLGAAAGALSLDGGTLAATASFSTARAITLGVGSGINVVGGATDLGVTSAIGGSGALTKLGTGVLTLQADNGYAGGTTITAGTLQLARARADRPRQHPGQRGQQRCAGVQPQQYLRLRRHRQRHGLGHATGQRRHGADG